jgi:hypothetical protein
MQFFSVSETDIPKEKQPNFVLSVEKGELGINAGLQDRVIQVACITTCTVAHSCT